MGFPQRPIPRSGLPHFHESSGQRSPRDSDAVPRVWQKNLTTNAQALRNALAIEQLQKDFNRWRKRKGGGDGGSTVGHIRGEWFSGAGTLTKQDDIWVVSTGATAGTYGALKDNPSFDLLTDPFVGVGEWIRFPHPNALGQWM